MAYIFNEINGGHNVGVRPSRDWQNETNIFQFREANVGDQASLEFLKLNLETGAEIQQVSWTWSNIKAGLFLGAAFTSPTAIIFNGNIAMGATGSKLYMAAASQAGFEDYQSVVLEFDRTTMQYTQSWVTAASDVSPRYGGTSIMNNNGTIFVRAGDQDTSIPTGYIDVLIPASSVYLRTTISSIHASLSNSICGLHSLNTAPIVFDNSDNLWFVVQPCDTSFNQTTESILVKATVNPTTGAITFVNSYTFTDEHNPWTPGGSGTFAQGYGFRRMVYHVPSNSMRFWTAWDNGLDFDYDEGWYWSFDISGGTFSGPFNWTAGRPLGSGGVFTHAYDTIGRTSLDYMTSLIMTDATYNNSSATYLNLYKGSTQTEQQFAFSNWSVPANWINAVHLSSITLFTSGDSDNFTVYMFDPGERFQDVTPFTYYFDALFVKSAPVAGGVRPSVWWL